MVGILGILHNLLVAGAPREPAASGIGLQYEDTIVAGKVMEVLWLLEEAYPTAGAALVQTFFPGVLTPREQRLWQYAAGQFQVFRQARTAYVNACGQGLVEPRPVLWRMPPLRRADGMAGNDDDIPVNMGYSPHATTLGQPEVVRT